MAKTTQRLALSYVMPLASQCKSDRLLHTKRLTGMWATYTMDVWVKELYGNRYAQVFSSRTYFAEIYPMAKTADER